MVTSFKLTHGDLSAPLMVQWELTYLCTNQCIFCHNPLNRGTSMSFDTARTVLRDLASSRVFRVVYTGGEPVLYPFLQDLVRETVDLGLEPGLISNGNQITHELLRVLKDHGLSSVQISIHSADARIHDHLTGTPGSFSQAMRTVTEAVRLGLNVNVNATLTSLNPNVVKLCEAVRQLGVRSFTVTRYAQTRVGYEDLVIPGDRLREEVVSLISYGKETGVRTSVISAIPLCAFASEKELALVQPNLVRCDGGLTWATITPLGMVKPCPPWELDCGSLLNESIRTIWKTSDTLRRIRDQKFIPPECRDCASFPVCRAGCRVCAMAGRNPPDALDPLANDAPLKSRLRSSKTEVGGYVSGG